MLAHRPVRGNPFFALACAVPAVAADPAFLGKNSCASSSCHGGGGAHQNQSIVWAQKDPHARAPATLATARSRRLADLLGIADPARDHRCTSCHAPWQNLAQLPPGASAVSEAISCETCHGPASQYLRSHTRTDLTRAAKLADGLRDLTVLYNRANACVACHQAVDSRLLDAGHPELLFELDGQTAAMPRHWREHQPHTHSAAWLTGQAAALRELTWQALTESSAGGPPHHRVFLQWQSALWILQAALPDGALAAFDTNSAAAPETMRALHRAADQLALAAGTPALLENLSRLASGFAQTPAGSSAAAARAERLVLALDRLQLDLPKERRAALQNSSDQLFRLIQSRPDFHPAQFAAALEAFRAALENSRPSP